MFQLKYRQICGPKLSAIAGSVAGTETIEGIGIMYINYDLARALGDERRKRSMTRAQIRQLRQSVPEPTAPIPIAEADIVELEFGAHCETDQIGA
jgi:hypothetical protein